MSNFNSVTLIGNCGGAPEVFRLGTKPPFAKLQIATNKIWKKEGVKHARTDWHTIILNRKLAEVAEKYLHKGDKVLIQGELNTRTWQDKEGNKRISVLVQAKELRFLTPKPDDAKAQFHVADTGHEADDAVNDDDNDNIDDIAF